MTLQNSNRKTLVVGASGQVGTQMLEALAGSGVLATSRKPRAGWLTLDLAELSTLAQAEEALDAHDLNAIFCVGGMTAVDACESAPDLAHRTNAVGPGVLAAYARKLGVPYVYYSTEYIFDGAKGNLKSYAEDAPPNALSVYGKSKLAGEHAVLAANPDALILRTTVVYGPDSRELNYVYSLMRNLAAGKTMRVPQDQVSTPTYNRDLVAATLGLVVAGATGIFHVAGPERMGRLEFAERIAAKLGLEASLLQGLDTSEMNQPAPRPLDAGLSIAKLIAQYPHIRMRTLDEAIEDCEPALRGFLAKLG